MKWEKAVSEYNWKNYPKDKYLFRFMIGQHTPDYDQSRDVKKWLGGKKGKGIGYKASPEKLVKLVKGTGAGVFYFYAKCHQGNFYYPSPTGHIHSAFKKVDFFGEMIKECIKQEVIPAALYETLDYRIINEKPEWCFRNDDGSIGLPCLNSPYGEFVLENLKEILAGYPLYSIYLDMVDAHSSANLGMLDSHASAGIDCPHCKALYEKMTEKEYPDTGSLDFAGRKEYLKWHAENYVGRFLKRALEVKNRYAPNCLLEYNFHNDLGRPWVAHDWKMAKDISGVFTCDIFAFHDGSIVDICVPKSYRTSSSGCRSWVLEDCSLGGEPSTPKPFDFYKVEMASVMSNGLDVCSSIFMEADGTMDATQANIIKKEFDYFKPLKKYYLDIEPVPFAALISPHGETTPLKSREEYSIHREEFEGWSKILTENHVLYDVVVDSFLDGKTLSRYNLLILPHCEAICDKTIKAIKTWVEKGGWLIVTGHTSLTDGRGRRRKDFGLKKVLGVSLVSTLDSKANYMHVTGKSTLDPDGTITPWHYLPSGQARIKALKGAEVLASLGEHPDIDRGKKHHIYYRHETGQPALTEFNNGLSSSFYFAGLPGQAYLRYQYAGISRLVKRLTAPVEDKFMPVVVGAPSCVQVEAAFQEKTNMLIINLMNRNGISGINALVKKGSAAAFTPQHAHRALPVYNLEVRVRERFYGRAAGAFLASCGKQADVRRSKGEVFIRIEKLDAHEILFVKFS